MKTLFQAKRTALAVTLLLILTAFSVGYAKANSYGANIHPAIKSMAAKPLTYDYSFKVHNNTNSTITKVLVSQDGKEYGYFDIGSGIAPGTTVELIWSSSTNGESCHQYFKAVFDTGEESQAVKFDFCESGLVLEF